MSTPHTDRELLEMAARAAGVSIVPCTCNNPKWPFKHAGDWSRGHWNPLESDADALRLAVAAQSHPQAGPITISLGVSALRADDADNASTLLERADAALYQAKKEGRNRVCVQP